MVHRKNLPNTASVANYESNGRLNAPFAARNAAPIVELVRKTAIRAFPAHLESLGDSHGCDFVIPS